MQKVLFVVDEKKIGGVSNVLENILNNIDASNMVIDVLVLHNNGDALTNLKENIKIIYGAKAFDVVDQDFKSLVKTGHVIKAIKKLSLSYKMKTDTMRSFIKKQRKNMGLDNYDIEIAFKSGFCSFVVAYSDARLKINWVHEDYNTYNRTKRYEKTFKKIFDMFNKHIVVSQKAAESFNNIYHMENKTMVIENYIDEKYIKEKALNGTLDIKLDNTKINFVTLGRFCYEKGFDRLIDAIKLLSEKMDITNLKVNILGYGELENKLNDQIKSLNLTDVIEIYDTTKMNNQVYSFMKACGVYIMSSRSESFGMTRIEAMLLGLPVITTNVANSDKLIQNKYGIIVENSTYGILSGIETILNDKRLFLSLKENVKDYSYSKQNEEIIKQIQDLLDGKRKNSETKEIKYTK